MHCTECTNDLEREREGGRERERERERKNKEQLRKKFKWQLTYFAHAHSILANTYTKGAVMSANKINMNVFMNFYLALRDHVTHTISGAL